MLVLLCEELFFIVYMALEYSNDNMFPHTVVPMYPVQVCLKSPPSLYALTLTVVYA